MIKKLWEKEGAGKQAPTEGIQYFFYLLYTYFWKVVALSIVLALFSIPIITLPAALTAANRVFTKLIRHGFALFWEEFWAEFKRSFGKALHLSLYYVIALGFSYYLGSLSLSNENNVFGMLLGIVGVLIALCACICGGCAFVLLAVQDLPVRQIRKNAWLLSLLCWKTSAKIAALFLLCVFTTSVSVWLFVLLLILIGFALLQYAQCWFLQGPLDSYVLLSKENEELN